MPTFLYPRLSLEIPTSNVYPTVGIGGTFINLPLTFDRASPIQSSMGATTGLSGGITDVFSTIRNGVATTVYQFLSKPLNSFTLSGDISFNTWARQGGAANNTSYRIRLFKYDTNGDLTSIGTTELVTELTTDAAGAATGISMGPTSTTFATGDRLLLRYAVVGANRGTVGGGNQTIFYNSPNEGVSGDTWLQLAENITFQDKLRFFVS